jgi:BON domain
MSNDEEQHRRSRVVVETPTERREVVQHQVYRTPERRGFSTGMVAAVALAAIAITSIIFLFIMTKGDDDTSVSANVRVSAQTTPVAQQPVMAPQSPVAQTPAPITTIVVPQTVPMDSVPPPTTGALPPTTTAPPTMGTEDMTAESKIRKAFGDDESLKNAGLSVIVAGGRALLSGSVGSQEAKERAVELARKVAGVKDVDASLVTVEPNTP